jgi:transposase InsO family protein
MRLLWDEKPGRIRPPFFMQQPPSPCVMKCGEQDFLRDQEHLQTNARLTCERDEARISRYAISRSIDARLAVAALKAAISARNPPRGCVHHSDRGSQYASEVYRAVLQKHGLTGSMGRRGNPYVIGLRWNCCSTSPVCAALGGRWRRRAGVSDFETNDGAAMTSNRALPETRLRGWGERTRTHESGCELCT